MTKTGRQSTKHHEMHTEEDAMKKRTPIYDFFPVGENRLYWYTIFIHKQGQVGQYVRLVDRWTNALLTDRHRQMDQDSWQETQPRI